MLFDIIMIMTMTQAITLNMAMTMTMMTMLKTMIGQAELEADDMEKMLFDLEIGFLHRTIWVMLCCHFDLKVK